ncbi:MAG: hypothetical protein J1F64_04175 [Oscillospiraceae bacterium]|nr:hypothetical protein [Oscillospiraceae bacterium]
MKKLLLALSLTMFIAGCSASETAEIIVPTVRPAAEETFTPTEIPLPEIPLIDNSTSLADYIDETEIPLTDNNSTSRDYIDETEIPKAKYIGNRNSKKFHKLTCYTLPKEKNRVYLNSREEAAAGGFSPCGKCCP